MLLEEEVSERIGKNREEKVFWDLLIAFQANGYLTQLIQPAAQIRINPAVLIS